MFISPMVPFHRGLTRLEILFQYFWWNFATYVATHFASSWGFIPNKISSSDQQFGIEASGSSSPMSIQITASPQADIFEVSYPPSKTTHTHD